MTIQIEQLEFETIIGILKEEREFPQKVLIDLEIEYEYKDEFLDYSKIVEFVTFFVQKNKFELVEVAVNETCQMLGDTFSEISQVTMKIIKPDIIKNAKVGVKTTKKF
ncbi:MAG: dihydroneopterin aldolase [Campylobacterales bacterium]|nr:dihydroneopterin aldolase [Campylobacterales bacterium]